MQANHKETALNAFQKQVYAGLDRLLAEGPLPGADGTRGPQGLPLFFEATRTWPVPENVPTLKYFLREHGDVVGKHIAGKAFLFGLLADESSREILLRTTLYSLLGPSFIGFPDWENLRLLRYKLIRSAQTGGDAITIRETVQNNGAVGVFTITLNLFDLGPIDPLKKFKLYSQLDTVLHIHNNTLYELTNEAVSIKAEKGDYVMDCGGCYGDTAVALAYAVKLKGHVFSFEPYPRFLEIMALNAACNPFLEKCLTIIPKAASKEKDLELTFMQCSEGSTYCPDKHVPDAEYISVRTTTIDAEVAQRALPRVDFIKMDIEGAELDALQGAEQTLLAFKPKLAVSIYHRLEDYAAIPAYLDGLNLGYRFYLGHQSTSDADVILFATAR